MPDIKELGRKVKAKFPGQYDDLDDGDLGRRIKAKYPGSYDDFSDTPAQPAQPPKPSLWENLKTGARQGYQDYIEAPIYSLAEAGQEAVKGNFTPAKQLAERAGRGIAKTYAQAQLPPGASIYQQAKIDQVAAEQAKRRVNNPAFTNQIIQRSRLADQAARDPSLSGRAARFVGSTAVGAVPGVLAGVASGGSLPAIAATAALQSADQPENAALNAGLAVMPLPVGKAVGNVARRIRGGVPKPTAAQPAILTGAVEDMAKLRAPTAQPALTGVARPRTPQQQPLFDAAARSPWQDSVLAYYRANLLTNPAGRALDLGSTLVNQFADAATRPVAAAADVIVSKLTGQRAITGLSARGTGRAFGSIRQGLRDAREVMRTGQQAIDTGVDDALYGREVVSGLGKGVDAPINGVFRVLGAMDAPFRRFGFTRNLQDRATVAAINESKRGLIPRDQITTRAGQLVDRHDIIEAAVRDGERAVLSEPNRISSWLARQTQASPNARLAIGIVQPFMRIPLNAVLKGADFAGIGGVKALYKIARGGARKAKGQSFFRDIEEQRVFAQNVASGSFAPAAFLLGMELEEQGKLEGYFYTSKKDFPNGRVPTSVNIGGENYDVNRLGGFILAPLFVGATYSRLRRQGSDQANGLLRSFSGLVQQAPSLGYFGVPAKAGRVLTADEPGSELVKEAGGIASGFIPASGLVGATAKALDKGRSREAEGFTGPIMSRIPGLRQQLPEKEKRQSVRGAAVARLREFGIEGVSVQRMKGEPDNLYNARRGRVEEWSGKYITALIENPGFARLTPTQQKHAIRNLQSNIHSEANDRNPNLSLFEPGRIISAARESERGQAERNRTKFYVEP